MRTASLRAEALRFLTESVASTASRRRMNSMDAEYGLTENAEVIFCRKVIIYFDRPTQQSVLKKLTTHLVPGGNLFVGHAETLHELSLPLVLVAPVLYRRTAAGA
jgi:chemotaxis protein methyltransferase CheR